MFNVKFLSFFKDGTELLTSISCPHYETYKRKDGTFTVTTFSTMIKDQGVERTVATDEHKLKVESYYHSCFIENSSGKTIHNVRPASIMTIEDNEDGGPGGSPPTKKT